MEWQWIKGAVTEPGPGVVWMRSRVDLVEGESMSPVQRLMSGVDSASGVSAALDPATWGFLNTELTVHVLRPPVGEWVCLSAETTLGTRQRRRRRLAGARRARARGTFGAGAARRSPLTG